MMRRSFFAGLSLIALSSVLYAGCVRERVIIVQADPKSGETNPTQTGGTQTTNNTAANPGNGQNQVAGDPQEWGIVGKTEQRLDYPQVVSKVENMISDSNVTSGAQRRGLSVVNVMWEDTGRAQGSSLG